MDTSETGEAFKPLDIKQLFMEKNPGMARSIPGFIYAYLTKILHLDSINEFLKDHGQKQGLEFVQAAIDDFNVSLEIIGEWNLPDTGRYIFVSNHPLGGFDGLLLMNIIGKRFPEIKSISNDILINVKNLSDFFLPVNKHGAQTPEIVKNMERVFNSDTQIMSFPAGLVSRRRKGIIRDVPWKKSFITKAVQHHRDVVPIHMSGRCTGFFYRLSNLRKFLGIKYNIEMFFLPDETYRHRNEHVIVHVGKPISWKTFNKRLNASQWALKVQDFVYTLPMNPDSVFKDS